MTEVPKIVSQRLRAAEAAAGTHPEADVLTAFAEQTLAATEREGVLAHLAVCGDCREIVAMALPEEAAAVRLPVESEEFATTAPARDVQQRARWSFGWGGLRWAALAAGVVVAVLAVRPMLEHPVKPAAVAEPGAVKPAITAQARETEQKTDTLSAESQPEVALKAAENKPAPAMKGDLGTVSGKIASLQPAPEKALSKLASTPPNSVGMLVANKKRADLAQKDSAGFRALGAATSAKLPEADKVQQSTEQAVVNTEDARLQTAPSLDSNATGDRDLMARAEAPAIEKAKPPLDEAAGNELHKTETAYARAKAARPVAGAAKEMASAAAAPAALANSISGVAWGLSAGMLRRSADGGLNWNTALKADRPLLCYAVHGQDVWAGGQAGTLQHSSDGGAAWTAVKASIDGRELSSDVTHIHVSDFGSVVVTTATQGTWVSADGGKTWAKK